MELNYSPFWFVVLMLIGFFFIGLSVFFAFQIAFGVEVESYKDCIEKEIPPRVCDMIYPPLKIQSVNYTIPFP